MRARLEKKIENNLTTNLANICICLYNLNILMVLRKWREVFDI